MKRLRDCALAAALFPWLLMGQSELLPSLDSQQRLDAPARLAQVPLVFEPVRGHVDGRAGYVSRTPKYTVLLNSAGAGFQVASTTNTGPAHIAMSFAGANQRAKGEAEERQAGTSSYFIGNDPASWLTAVPHYGRVTYRNAYPGIDVVYYGNQRQIEYDLVLSPGADPGRIKLKFRGVRGLRIDESGNLILESGSGQIRQKKPVIYQHAASGVRHIDGSYVLLASGEVGFRVGLYDRTASLIIDPVLIYSSFLGGSGWESTYRMALDSAGNIYLAGATTSSNFPTQGAFRPTLTGTKAAFVTKISPAGQIVYSSYLGGSGSDAAEAIAVDSSGNAYVTGQTTSTNFPTVGPYQAALRGASDAFLAKINAGGSALVYSTYFGGTGPEYGLGIGVDGSGRAYVGGFTGSTNLPTLNAVQATYGGSNDVFVTAFSASGNTLAFSTYLGGSGEDYTNNVLVDSAGNAYIVGDTTSTNFPTLNAYQATKGTTTDAFVARLDSAGTLLSSTYFGGNGVDAIRDLALDASGNMWISGESTSTNLPTLYPIQSTNGGARDGFLAKLSASGTGLLYGTYFGGSGDENLNGMALDSGGSVYLAGATTSSNFPTLNALQNTLAGGSDAVLVKIASTGFSILVSTYLGGAGFDFASDIAVDSQGAVYVTGETASSAFPTVAAFQPANAGSSDVFISKVSTCIYSLSPLSESYGYSAVSGTVLVTTTPDCSWTASTSTSWITLTGAQSGTGNGSVAYSVAANAVASPRSGSIIISGQSFPIDQAPAPAPPPTLASIAPNVSFPGAAVTVTLTGANFVSGATIGSGNAGITFTVVQVLSGSSLTATAQIAANVAPGSYNVTVTTANGTSNAVPFTVSAVPVGATLTGAMAIPSGVQNLTAIGTADWAHYGFGSGFNHKAGVTSQISNFTMVGGGTASTATNVGTYSWSDGTPAASATTSNIVWVAGLNRGFRLQVPADTTVRTLKVYAGIWYTRARLVAHLSDSSAPDYVNTTLSSTDMNEDPLGVYTLTYAAASAGQSLQVTFTQDTNTVGNVNLAAAALIGPPDFGLSANPASQIISAGNATAFTVSTASLSGFSGQVSLSVTGLPGGASASFAQASVPAGSSTTLTITTSAGTTVGTYPLTVTGTSGSLSHTANATLVVAGTGSVSGAFTIPTAAQVLSTLGAADWAHWGQSSASSFNHKSGVTQQISNYALVGTGTVSRYTGHPFGFTWTGGTPTASATNTATGISVSGTNSGFSITLPADTTTRTVSFYVAARSGAQTRMTAHLSDNSYPDYVDTSVANASGTTAVLFTFTYKAGAPNQTLTLTFIRTNSSGNVAINAATLNVAPSADFIAGLTPGSQTVTSGNPAAYTVSITPQNGFTGDVSLAASGLPAGAAASFNPATVLGGSGSATLTITTTAALTAGTYPFTVTATSGSLTRTANATLVVTGPPDFTLQLTPSSQTVAATGSASYTATITAVNGFTGTAVFGIGGLPSGVTATLNPVSVTGSGATTITVTAGSTAQPGSYPLTLTATSGALSHTANATLAVTGPPDFTVSASPATQSVSVGSSTSYTVSIAGQNGFGGATTFSVSGLPSGATPGFSPASVTGTGNSSLTIATSAAAVPGTYPLTITATSGTLVHTASVSLTIALAPDFSLSASPSTRSVVAGVATSYTVSASALNGFASNVSFSASGLPAGASASFSPAQAAPGVSSTITVTTAVTTAPGTYTLTVSGTGGSLTRTTTVALVVTSTAGLGLLSGSLAAAPGTVSLSSVGTADWAHWGYNSGTAWIHKSGVTSQIGNISLVNGGSPANAINVITYSWTGGTPTASATTANNVWVSGLNRGFQFSVPADTMTRTLRVYAGLYFAQGKLVAHLSDGSAVDYVDTSIDGSGDPNADPAGVYTITYRAVLPGQTLTIKWTQNSAPSPYSNVNIGGAALTVP